MRLLAIQIILLVTLGSANAFAETAQPKKPSAQPGGAEYQQKLDFEDELVEGMNKKPYDSLAQISDKDRKKNDGHIYWKRTTFQPESNETLRELRFVQ